MVLVHTVSNTHTAITQISDSQTTRQEKHKQHSQMNRKKAFQVLNSYSRNLKLTARWQILFISPSQNSKSLTEYWQILLIPKHYLCKQLSTFTVKQRHLKRVSLGVVQEDTLTEYWKCVLHKTTLRQPDIRILWLSKGHSLNCFVYHRQNVAIKTTPHLTPSPTHPKHTPTNKKMAIHTLKPQIENQTINSPTDLHHFPSTTVLYPSRQVTSIPFQYAIYLHGLTNSS